MLRAGSRCTRCAARPQDGNGRPMQAPHSAPLARSPRALATCAPARSRAGNRTRLRASAQVEDVSSDAHSSSGAFPRGHEWTVHKFGGTCVSAADRISGAGDVIAQLEGKKKLVVVSAMGAHPRSPTKVTDLILNMIRRAAAKDDAFLLDLATLQEKHVSTAKELLGGDEAVAMRELTAFTASLLDDIGALKSILQGISVAGLTSEAFSDFIVGHGEVWSARLFAASMRLKGHNALMMDARDILVVDPTPDGQSVDVEYEASNRNLDHWAKTHGDPDIIICTGFIARNQQKQVTTLRRNGSDYSATIFGALTQCREITIWTDVDGVYSADPRRVPDAVCLESLSYHEAWELSYFGANVLHPRTTLPAMRHKIPVVIRNYFALDVPGTRILDLAVQPPSAALLPVSGFATIENVSMINVEGTGMQGVPGTAASIFSTLRDENVNVIMISQASSEHSVCFAVAESEGARAQEVLRARFADAIKVGRVHDVDNEQGCAVLAAVGQRMAKNKGVAATMFEALAKASVNIKALAQGSSEYNITVIVNQSDINKALRAVHSKFFLSTTTLNMALIGPGLIGSTLLNQVCQQRECLRDRYKMDLRVLAIVGSKRMLLSDTGVDLCEWRTEYDAASEPACLDKLVSFLDATSLPNVVVVDCTASEEPTARYEGWLEAGLHVITPNKRLGSGPLERYNAVRSLMRRSYTMWYYEATVGAGLPIIATLKHLRETGDRIISIEGVFSGTMSYLFNSLRKGGPAFSELVQEAMEAGYTEPDPRNDLSGTDVARKVIILAREAGFGLELDNIPVHSLEPGAREHDTETKEEFLANVKRVLDGQLADDVFKAHEQGKCLRYVGVVDCKEGSGSVGVREYPADHPFCQLSGSDNIIAFRTERYNEQPLIVRGPGAGAEVTAAGVFSDVLRLASYLGAPI